MVRNPEEMVATDVSFRNLDYLCQGLGIRCMICGNKIPKGGGVCPNISDTELVHEVAREFHYGGRER